MKTPLFVTNKGLARLHDKRLAAQDELRGQLSKKAEAADVGGNVWHDNFAFEEIERQERQLTKKISDITLKIGNAVVVPEKPPGNSVVSVGNTVTITGDDGSLMTYLICGYGETDLSANPPKIEYLAPVVAPFFGESVGHEEELFLRGKHIMLTLLKIV